ncbi:MAG: sodium/solute symporter [Thermoguttaceae bacterium]|nr:sodium/solute symporter [Thermoguttaceae bacterium]
MTNFLFAQAASAFGNCAYVLVFFAFLAAVAFVAFGMSRNSGGDSESYFLAGRGLKWWLIGFSLIAANISAEQFVGMSGQAADYIGLAVASYEWIAALSLVIVAFFFLPRFLKAGIYTIPEYLETRYNKSARSIMSIMMMIMLVAVNITVVTFAGAKAYAVFFDGMTLGPIALDLTFFCWAIGIFAALYIFAGGLKACAWADLLQGSALILAGAVVLFFSLKALGSADISSLAAGSADAVSKLTADMGAWERFSTLNADKLRMNLPSWDLVLPVTALIFAIWIPNLYYWGLNQYIIQRTLGAKSLGEGQKGLVFAAFMKLLIPFIVIFPGMIALNLFSADMKANADKASAKEMARFEEVKANPTSDATLFSFNRSFASTYPEKADEILAFNAAASGVNLDEAVAAAKEAGKINDGMKPEELQVAKLAAIQAKAPTAKTGAMLNGCDYDAAFPLLMAKVVPTGGFKGFMLAALLGAIVSSVAAMLNAASTIFSMDIYNEYLVNKNLDEAARQKKLVLVGRIAVVAFVLIGCIVAPMWANPKFGGVFKAIQEFQGYISPGIFAAFVVGFWMKKAPNSYGAIALIACPILYGALAIFVPSLDFLNRMAVTFGVLIALAIVMTIVCPRKEAFVQATDESKAEFLKESKGAKIGGWVVVALTVVLYLIYWDYDLPMF